MGYDFALTVRSRLCDRTVLALTEFAWSLGLVRVEIRCDAKNLRSRAVAERAGFAMEGVLKNDCRTPQGDIQDIYVFAQVSRNAEMLSRAEQGLPT
jgi:RimJ/RimL family protein N-acetyltransferase